MLASGRKGRKQTGKMAFIVPKGLYEFQTMPFRLGNVAATFQHSIQTAQTNLFQNDA